ncbi:MAG: PDZ domain-containing protein [Desulfobacterales bacterium]|nr:PDZ domain-containing protein [Desulfobacterales bacterium]
MTKEIFIKRAITGLTVIIIFCTISFSLLALYKTMTIFQIMGNKQSKNDSNESVILVKKNSKPITNTVETKTEKEKIISNQDNHQLIKETDLKIKLFGTVTGKDVDSFAIIDDLSTGKRTLYKVGDVILGASIKEIFRKKITLIREGKEEFLSLKEQNTPQETIETASENPSEHQTVPQENQGNAPTKFTSITVGKSKGLKITNIEPESLLSQMGLRDNDVITLVNGKPVDSIHKLSSATSDNSRNASPTVRLEILRDGKQENIEVDTETIKKKFMENRITRATRTKKEVKKDDVKEVKEIKESGETQN